MWTAQEDASSTKPNYNSVDLSEVELEDVSTPSYVRPLRMYFETLSPSYTRLCELLSWSKKLFS